MEDDLKKMEDDLNKMKDNLNKMKYDLKSTKPKLNVFWFVGWVLAMIKPEYIQSLTICLK